MLRFAALASLLLLVPAATAGPGHDEVPLLEPFSVSLVGEEVQGASLPTALANHPGLVVFTGKNRGSTTVGVDLYVEADVVHTWSFPPDRNTHVKFHMVNQPGNLSVDFYAQGAAEGDKNAFDFFYDHAGICGFFAPTCTSKHLPWQVPQGAAVFPYTAPADGTYRVNVREPAVHDLRVELRGADGETILASQRNTGPQETLRMDFEGMAGERFHVVAFSEAHDRRHYYDANYNEDLESIRVALVVEGPLSQEAPASLGLTPLALLAAGALARTGRRETDL